MEAFGQVGLHFSRRTAKCFPSTTADREAVKIHGHCKKWEWASPFAAATEERGGIKRPTILKAVWHLTRKAT